MSHSRDRRRLTNLALLLLISASCESEATYPGPQPSGVRLDHASLVLPDGDSARVSLLLEYPDGRARPPAQGGNAVAWASSNPDIASVDDAGWIRAHRPGEAWVSARVEQLQTGVAVRVEQVPSAFAYVAGDAQEDTVGSSLSQPLVVRVVDRHGDGVPGLRVDFSVKAGGGTVSPSSVTTAGSGEASASWTLGTEATVQTAEAEVVGFEAEPIQFEARGKPGTPYLLVELGGDQQSGAVGEALPAELVAQIRDKHGNPVPAVTTTWSVLIGGGSAAPAVTVTDEQGRASTSWTLGSTAGPQGAMAEVAGLPGVPFEATAMPGPVASVTVAPASVTLDVGGSVQLSATLRDAFGNPLPNEPVSWSSSSVAASVTGSGLVTGSSAGSAIITAASGTASGSAAVTVEPTQPPPPASLTKVSGDGQSGTVGAQLPTPLTIRVADASGNDLPNVAVEWAVTSGGGSVSSGTTATDAEGLARVTWTLGGTVGTQTASAAVAGLPSVSFSATGVAGPVASVSVTPASATIDVGTSVQLTATLSDAWGNPTTGSVAWSSSSSAVASVSPAGLVSGVAAGSTTVTATSNGASGSASITVEAGAGTSVRECDSPQSEWIWCDDFEDDRLNRYFEYDASGGLFARAGGVGADGSYGMRARWAQTGQLSAGFLHLAFGKTPQAYFTPVDAGTAIYRDVYWRVYVRNQPGWTGGGADKLSRATSFASSTSWAQAMIAHVWSGSSPDQSYLVLDPASGTDEQGNLRTTEYNDFANLRWLGAVRGATPLFADANVGVWYCVEAHARLNDPGQSNGVFEMWIDGAIDAQKTGLNWVGSFAEYGINAVFLENYWNSGAPQAQERYLDNFVVSTQRIGCGGAPPPSEVTSVTITPAADTINALGDTIQLTAAARDASGASVSTSITWSSLNPDIATVDALGRVVSKAAGIALISAHAGCCVGDTASVSSRQVVSSVSVTPAAASLAVGDTLRLTATAVDSNGVAVPGVGFTWASSDPNVAHVTADLVEAIAAGSATILASGGGMSGSSSITVSGSQSSCSNEPSGATPIIDQGWSSYFPTGGWETNDLWTPFFSLAEDPDAPQSPTSIMRGLVPEGIANGVTAYKAWRNFAAEEKYPEIYVCYWVKHSETWVPHPVGTKIMFFNLSSPGWNANTSVYTGFGGADMTLVVNQQNQPWGNVNRAPNTGDSTYWNMIDFVGQWVRYEFLLRLNTEANADGIIKVWVQGNLTHDYSNVQFLDAADPHTWESLTWTHTYGGIGGEALADQYEMMDHIYVSGRN